MIEKPAQGTKGYFLYSPFGEKFRYFFRIYHENGEFTDYDIRCEEIEVELLCDSLSLYSMDDGSKVLDWSSKALGRETK